MEEEKKKKGKCITIRGKALTIYIIIIVVVASAISFGSGFILGKKMYEEKKKEPPKEIQEKAADNNKKISVDLSSEEFEKLISYLPVRATIFADNFDTRYNVYQGSRVEVTDVPLELLYEVGLHHSQDKEFRKNDCMAEYGDINGLCDYLIKVSDLKEMVIKLYGIDKEPVSNISNNLLHCTRANDVYACSTSGGGWATSNIGTYLDIYNTYYINYVKAEKDDEYLYVYVDYVGYKFDDIKDLLNESISDYKFKVYKNSNPKELMIDDYLLGKDFYVENQTEPTFKEKLFDYIGDKKSTFVNVYKINNDGTYNWVYTEPVNNS